MIVAKFFVVILIGYILGSIPFGAIVARLMGKGDVRGYGSGKIGTTNVLRVAGKKAAFLVAVCDISKGALAVVFAGLIVGRSYLVVGDSFALGALVAQCVAALAAMAGHNWPVFLKFKGGRGVATFFGGLVALCPAAAIFGGEVLILGTGLTRFSSLGSIAGVVSAYSILIPLTVLNGFPIEYLVYTFIGTIAIIIMHRDNIVRLFNGKERKLGEKTEVISSVSSPPSDENTG